MRDTSLALDAVMIARFDDPESSPSILGILFSQIPIYLERRALL